MKEISESFEDTKNFFLYKYTEKNNNFLMYRINQNQNSFDDVLEIIFHGKTLENSSPLCDIIYFLNILTIKYDKVLIKLNMLFKNYTEETFKPAFYDSFCNSKAYKYLTKYFSSIKKFMLDKNGKIFDFLIIKLPKIIQEIQIENMNEKAKFIEIMKFAIYYLSSNDIIDFAILLFLKKLLCNRLYNEFSDIIKKNITLFFNSIDDYLHLEKSLNDFYFKIDINDNQLSIDFNKNT